MELNELFIIILNTIDMSMALSIGVFLILLNKKKKNALLFLGFFLIVSGLSSLSDISSGIYKYVENPYLELIPFDFFSLMPSLLYVYLGEISIIKNKKTTYYVLIPGLLSFIVNAIIYFLNQDLKLYVTNSGLYILFVIVEIFYGFVIIFLTFKKVRKHSKLLKNQYSSTERRELNWLLLTISSVIVFFPVMVFVIVFLDEFIADVFSSIFGILIVYWTSYHGLLQQSSTNLILEKNDNFETKEKVEVDVSEPDKDLEKYVQVIEKVDALMLAEELFLNPELTIIHISERIEEHPRLVSTAINKVRAQNFNSYINKHRIEKAKMMLLSGINARLNIEGIGLESGFKSNSSFYAAFKKCQKITPLQFVKHSELQ